MPRPFATTLAAALLVLSSASPAQAPPPDADSPLAARIATLLADPTVSHDHWGIAVTTLDGAPVFSLDDAKLFRPASTAKLFTAAAALALLGPETRFTTSIYGDLDPATGIVHGDLTLLGGGDPSFGTHDLPFRQSPNPSPDPSQPNDASLAALVAQLTAAGVHQVQGNILGDDTLFESPTVPDGWAAEDLLWGYGALPSALSIADNQLILTVRATPSQSGSLAAVDQLYPYLQVQNDVLTLPDEPAEPNAVGVQSLSGTPEAVRVYGRLSPDSKPVNEELALNDPAAYAAGSLRALLLQGGVAVTGDAKPFHRPPTNTVTPFLSGLRRHVSGASPGGIPVGEAHSCLGAPHSNHLLAEHTSPPLTEDLTFTLKTSANLHAEVLLHHIGLKAACPGVTTLDGARVVYQWLLHIGLTPGDFLFYDGSGLSAKDLVTPRAEAQLLAYAATQPWFPQFRAALPLGGVDGTLANRFTQPPLKANVSAKTGTLGESRALAGYVHCASGKDLIFAILVDNHPPSTSADRTTMDQLVAAIAATN